MIDIKHLRQHPEEYKRSAKLRGVKVDIEELIKADERRVELTAKIDLLRAKLNVKGKPSDEQLKGLQKTKSDLEPLEKELSENEKRLTELSGGVPNLIAEDTPEGGEEQNREEKTWGDAAKKKVIGHLELAEANDWLDFDRGAKVAGSKFYYAKGALVRLELALLNMVVERAEKAGFTLMSVPHLVNDRIADGSGFEPRGDERQTYRVEDAGLNLIGTSEIPLTGYHADEIIDPNKLPLLYAAYSPSYRQEAGAYGRYSKGLYRVHQFNKVEMYVFCQSDESDKWHQQLVDIEEQIAQELEIPYRIVRIAAGDLGAPAYKKYDLEYWSPAENEYRELMSCSNCTDYQSRRLNIRTRNKDGKTEFVHTLNGTAAAFSRILIAILENYQTDDKNVNIPKALQPYYGKDQLK